MVIRRSYVTYSLGRKIISRSKKMLNLLLTIFLILFFSYAKAASICCRVCCYQEHERSRKKVHPAKTIKKRMMIGASTSQGLIIASRSCIVHAVQKVVKIFTRNANRILLENEVFNL